MFLAIPIVYWLTWAFFIVNDMPKIGILYATGPGTLQALVEAATEAGLLED